MTVPLQEAFRAMAQLPENEQDALAMRLLAEMAKEDEFDLALQRTGHKLADMALSEHRAGQTLPFPSDSE
jgi:hypothetical protein